MKPSVLPELPSLMSASSTKNALAMQPLAAVVAAAAATPFCWPAVMPASMSRHRPAAAHRRQPRATPLCAARGPPTQKLLSGWDEVGKLEQQKSFSTRFYVPHAHMKPSVLPELPSLMSASSTKNALAMQPLAAVVAAAAATPFCWPAVMPASMSRHRPAAANKNILNPLAAQRSAHRDRSRGPL